MIRKPNCLVIVLCLSGVAAQHDGDVGLDPLMLKN